MTLNNQYIASKKTNVLLTFLCFLLFPGWSLPLLLLQIYYNHKFAYVCLGILMGLWSFLLAPIGDVYRYSMDYYLYRDFNFDQFCQFLLLKNDYLLGVILYTLSYLNIPPDFSRFLYVTTGSTIIFLLIYNFSVQYRDMLGRKNCFLIFLFVFLNIKFSNFSFRFALSCTLYLLGGLYIINNKKKKLAYLLLSLSVINHISFIIFIVPLFLCCIFPNFGSKRLSIILLILAISFSGTFLNDILKNLAPHSNLVQHALYYTDGVWAGDFLEDHSLFFRIKLLIDSIPIYTLLIIFCYVYKKNKWSSWIEFLLILIVITAPYVSLKARCQSVLFFPLLFYILHRLSIITKQKRNLIIITLLLTGCIATISSLWGNRRELSMSQEQKLFTANIIKIFSHSYDYNWLQRNVNEDGSPANINY